MSSDAAMASRGIVFAYGIGDQAQQIARFHCLATLPALLSEDGHASLIARFASLASPTIESTPSLGHERTADRMSSALSEASTSGTLSMLCRLKPRRPA